MKNVEVENMENMKRVNNNLGDTQISNRDGKQYVSSGRMKIVSGLGSIDEYIRFVNAGADEFFCGFVPYEWSRRYGVISPLNRREVLFYNVQIGSFSELKILKSMVDRYHVPVKITLNSLYYQSEQYPMLEELILRCMEIGFDTFIIADPALIVHLRKKKIQCRIHLSGETAEVNHLMMECFERFHIQRFIFHRKNTIDDMRSCIQHEKDNCSEYEAFILNERCHFTGAFCNSLHCDELTHLCRVPYELVPVKKTDCCKAEETADNGKAEVLEENHMSLSNSESDWSSETDESNFTMEGYHTGQTGCGLCSIWKLKAAGVTHLKLVGRGNYTDYMEQDIRQLKRAIDYSNRCATEQEYIRKVKKELLGGYCSRECYYS